MKALLIVDLQNDFMPGGALGVPGADQLAPLINQLIPQFPLVVASLDWHPMGHISFASSHVGKNIGDQIDTPYGPQRLWPDHCVQHSTGAALVRSLNPISHCFYKGTHPQVDSYSIFFDNASGLACKTTRAHSTGLADFLKKHGVTTLFLAGVATEYCVLYSALDALELGFEVFVIIDATRAICSIQGRQALDRIVAAGGHEIFSFAI